MPGFCILLFAQVHVDGLGDAIEPSHLLPLKREKLLILADPGHPLQ